ncbi:MAG: hypothetical protein JWP04_2997 [Belnapia sp.]|jgi:hypothetical protein|nr:hypothetical protein [Belnapia sp.]
MTRFLLLGAGLLLAACTSLPSRTGPAAPPPAPNTGLLRPSLEIDPGIRAPVPSDAPATTPVIPPNPRIDAR